MKDFSLFFYKLCMVLSIAFMVIFWIVNDHKSIMATSFIILLWSLLIGFFWWGSFPCFKRELENFDSAKYFFLYSATLIPIIIIVFNMKNNNLLEIMKVIFFGYPFSYAFIVCGFYNLLDFHENDCHEVNTFSNKKNLNLKFENPERKPKTTYYGSILSIYFFPIIVSTVSGVLTYMITHTLFGFGTLEASLGSILAALVLGAMGYKA